MMYLAACLIFVVGMTSCAIVFISTMHPDH